MSGVKPTFLVMGGPNGAGKSTCAAGYTTAEMTYINADEIAKSLASYPSPAADMQAARLALDMMDRFEANRSSFAVETTLASRSLAARLARLRSIGYTTRLVFLWTPNAEFSIRRVASRVRAGGHHIPEETIRRRYRSGIENFLSIYRAIVDEWFVVEDLDIAGPRLVAEGGADLRVIIHRPEIWDLINRRVDR